MHPGSGQRFLPILSILFIPSKFLNQHP